MTTATSEYRIILTDDHPILREGLKRLISDDNSLQVIGEANNGQDLLEMLELQENACDLVILDLTMPVMNGLEAAREIRNRFPDMKILILTMHDNRSHFLSALSLGVDGYLLKDDVFDSLVSGIQSIREGKTAISKKMEIFQNESPEEVSFPQTNNRLTDRELEVLSFVALGLTSKQIGEKLGISSRTVESHRARVMDKLKIRNVAGLVKYAVNQNILPQ